MLEVRKAVQNLACSVLGYNKIITESIYEADRDWMDNPNIAGGGGVRVGCVCLGWDLGNKGIVSNS